MSSGDCPNPFGRSAKIGDEWSKTSLEEWASILLQFGEEDSRCSIHDSDAIQSSFQAAAVKATPIFMDRDTTVQKACRLIAEADRLSRLPDGRLAYRLKRIWSDGTTEFIFEPLDFLGKLAALVPPPRVHRTRFFGVLGPAANWRASVVPAPARQLDGLSSTVSLLAIESAGAPASMEPENARHSAPSRNTWARLMMRSFNWTSFAVPTVAAGSASLRRYSRQKPCEFGHVCDKAAFLNE